MSDSIARKLIPKVSVSMAVFQQKSFIREALDSVLIQNYPNMEVIIGDDCSTDGTQEILKEYARKYPELIRLILAKENTGITGNCNRILKGCTGQYIAFMAGDDIWLPGKIQAQVDYLESHPRCSICYHNMEVFDSDSGEPLYYFNGREANHPYEGKAEFAVQYGTFNGAISNMVRRADCPPHGFDSRVSAASDWLFWVNILLNGGEIHYLDRVFARYRKHKNNITQLTQLRNYREHLKSANIILKNKPGMIKEVLFRKADIYNVLMQLDGNKYRRMMWSTYRKLNARIYKILLYFNNLAKTILGGNALGSTHDNVEKKLSDDGKLKIVFFIYNLEAGGAERVLLNIVRNIDRRRFIPVLYLLSKKGSLLPLVPADTSIISLSDVHVPEYFGFWFFFLFKRLREQIGSVHPHILLSFMWYPNALAIILKKLMRGKCKIIVSERTSTSIYAGEKAEAWRNRIIRFLYPHADGIITPSSGIANNLISKSIQRKKIYVVHNPVDIDMVRQKALEQLDHPWYAPGAGNIITAIGRLGSEKGFDCLVKAVGILTKASAGCKLVIVGEGQERLNLEKLITALQLEDRVQLVGFQQNPYKYLSLSTVFVLSSRYEGFPNVLLEALSLGIPSVATRCLTGPDEIITDGVNGILVAPDDEKALADGIGMLLKDEELRRKLSLAGKARSEDFRVNTIVKQFEKAIEDVCAASAQG